MEKPWTEAHRREALRRTYEIAAEIAAKDDSNAAAWLCEGAAGYAQTEALWRSELGDHCDPARIDREVRRVRALAEGRLVRETAWTVVGVLAAEEDHVVWEGTYRPGPPLTTDRRVVRVTRIRRAR